MARTYGALSDTEIAWVRNQMSKGAKADKLKQVGGMSARLVGDTPKKAPNAVNSQKKPSKITSGLGRTVASVAGKATKTAARGIKNAVSKASKPIYSPMAAPAVRAAAKGASKIASKIRK